MNHWYLNVTIVAKKKKKCFYSILWLDALPAARIPFPGPLGPDASLSQPRGVRASLTKGVRASLTPFVSGRQPWARPDPASNHSYIQSVSAQHCWRTYTETMSTQPFWRTWVICIRLASGSDMRHAGSYYIILHSIILLIHCSWLLPPHLLW